MTPLIQYRATADDAEDFRHQGFLLHETVLDTKAIPALHQAFEDLFNGQFETGVEPDEVNWQQASGDPTLTRQICNGWKANRAIARVVLDQSLAKQIARLAGWSGVRIMIDNVLWKPPGARSLGFHQDSAFLSWFTPSDLLTCWIALDDTTADGGTIEYVAGSHRWPPSQPEGEFHGPERYRLPLQNAAAACGECPNISYVEVPAGGGSFHHGWMWHGSGPNSGNAPRRSLVLHAMQAHVQYNPDQLAQGIGPTYSRYKRLADNELDENYFPILWREDGYRTPGIEAFLNP